MAVARCGWRIPAKNAESFGGFIDFISDNTVTTLNSSVLVAYSVHSMFQNMSAKRTQWLIDNGHTPVKFLSACCIQEQFEKKEGPEDENGGVRTYIIG